MVGRQRFGNLRSLRRLAGKQVTRLLADHDVPLHRDEAAEQADLPLLTSQFIPRQPEAVGVLQHSLVAVVLRELLFGEHEFALRDDVVLKPRAFVEGIHRERAGHLDRLPPFVRVKHQPAAETARRRGVAVGHYRLRPIGHQLHGTLELPLFAGAPGDVLFQIERRAAG